MLSWPREAGSSGEEEINEVSPTLSQAFCLEVKSRLAQRRETQAELSNLSELKSQRWKSGEVKTAGTDRTQQAGGGRALETLIGSPEFLGDQTITPSRERTITAEP